MRKPCVTNNLVIRSLGAAVYLPCYSRGNFQMDLLDQGVTLALLGIIFLFGGLGVLKLLRQSDPGSSDESPGAVSRRSSKNDGDERDENA